MRNFKWFVDWCDLSAVFDTREGAINYVKEGVKELEANILESSIYGTWAEFMVEYPTTMKDKVVINSIDYYAK